MFFLYYPTYANPKPLVRATLLNFALRIVLSVTITVALITFVLPASAFLSSGFPSNALVTLPPAGSLIAYNF